MNELEKKGSNEIAIYSKDEFLTKFAPMNMVVEFRHVKTMELAISEDTKGLSYYSKQVGELTVIAIIEAHLIGLNKSINVKLPLTPLQVKEIAIEIQSMYYFLSMVEVNFIFRTAKRGGYGVVYNALSMENILSWFEKYSMERSNHFINNQMRVHDKYKDDSLRSDEKKELRRHNEIITDHKNKDNG